MFRYWEAQECWWCSEKNAHHVRLIPRSFEQDDELICITLRHESLAEVMKLTVKVLRALEANDDA